jgi:hypothetical protein
MRQDCGSDPPALSFDADAIAEITRFGDTGVLPYFGLPRSLPAG